MKALNYILAALLLIAAGYIGWNYFNPKVEKIYVQIKPKPEIVIKEKPDGGAVTSTNIIHQEAPEISLDSIKEKWAELLPVSEQRTQKITELTELTAKLQGELNAKNAEVKQLTEAVQQWQGKYLSVTINKDSGTVKYAYDAKIKIAGTKKDKYGNVTEVSVTSPDPAFKVTGMEVFRQEVRYPKTILNVRTELGGFYDIQGRGFPAAYGGIRADFFREARIYPFIGAGYLYDGNWRPYATAGIGFNLINWKK